MSLRQEEVEQISSRHTRVLQLYDLFIKLIVPLMVATLTYAASMLMSLNDRMTRQEERLQSFIDTFGKMEFPPADYRKMVDNRLDALRDRTETTLLKIDARFDRMETKIDNLANKKCDDGGMTP